MICDRFVIDTGVEARLDADGFLVVPPRETLSLDASSHPMEVRDLVGSTASFVLLAPPAAGKSTVFDLLRQLEPEAIDIRPESRDLVSVEAAIRNAVANGVAVYLDQLDEAAIHQPQIFRLLERLVVEPEATHARWRLACRPAVWNTSLSATLMGTLPSFQELRLLPLDRAAATEVVSQVVNEPLDFLDALRAVGLRHLPATPGRLLTTARAWNANHPLPTDPVASLELELAQLLLESDPGRPLAELNADERRHIAERLAAISLFCGKPRFAIDPTVTSSAANISELPATPEPESAISAALTPRSYREVLDTPLFDVAEDSTLAFRHHQDAEYLAAAFLIRRKISRSSLGSLLGVQPDGLLPEPMAGIVIWLASLQPELTEGLLRANAVALARTAVELPTDEGKAAVVDGLLTGASHGELGTEWGLDLSPLVHGGLCNQLAAAPAWRADRPALLWWTARLALAGGCRQLVEPLLEASLDPRWPDWARSACITTVGALGEHRHLEQLRTLLALDRADDPDDELLAHALEVLYPRLLGTAEVLAVLRPPRRRNLLGAYAGWLADFAEEIPTAELPTALDWLAATLPGNEDAFGRLPFRLVAKAWDTRSVGPIVPALARLLLSVDRTPAGYELTHRQTPPWNETRDTGARRRLAVAVAERNDDDGGWFLLLDTRLLHPDDVPWLVEELTQLPQAAHKDLAECLPMLVNEPSAALADQILDMPVHHPAYEATERLRRAVSLDSEGARRQRERRMREADRDDVSWTPEQHRDWLVGLLHDAENDIEQWWKIVYSLAVDEHRSDSAIFTHDLTARPGWRLLDQREQNGIIELGLAYLHHHDLQPELWRGRRSIDPTQAIPDWAGVYLLTTLVRLDRGQVAALEPDVWRQHAPAIIGAWNHEDLPGDRDRRNELVALAPRSVRSELVRSLIDHLDAEAVEDHGFVPEIAGQLFPEATEPLADRLTSAAYPDQLAASVLDALVDHAPHEARTLCHQLRWEGTEALSTRAERHLSRLDPVAMTDDLLTGDVPEDRAANVIMPLDFTMLDDERLSQLAGFLLDRFPIRDDPPLPATGSGMDDRVEIGLVRSRILNRLVEHGQHEALERILVGLIEPDTSVLWRMTHLARAQAANLALTPVSPSGLLELVSRTNVHLVRHDADLQAVVLEHLSLLQAELTDQGGYQDVWNELPNGPSRLKSEDVLSQWVARRLQAQLSTAAIIDREVQVTPSSGGIGTRVDLAATAATSAQPCVQARVIIEAKRYDHRELGNSLTDQLARRYLEHTGVRHGVYLVYWVDPDQRPDGGMNAHPTERQQLQQQLEEEASLLSPRLLVRPFILDMGHP